MDEITETPPVDTTAPVEAAPVEAAPDEASMVVVPAESVECVCEQGHHAMVLSLVVAAILGALLYKGGRALFDKVRKLRAASARNAAADAVDSKK
jgi:hypothetical protein